MEYEADPRQAEKLIEELGLNGAKGLSTPAVKPSIGNIRSDKPLPEDKVTHFRALAARANCLSQDSRCTLNDQGTDKTNVEPNGSRLAGTATSA